MKQKLFNVLVTLHLIFLTVQTNLLAGRIDETQAAIVNIVQFLIQLTSGGQ